MVVVYRKMVTGPPLVMLTVQLVAAAAFLESIALAAAESRASSGKSFIKKFTHCFHRCCESFHVTVKKFDSRDMNSSR